LQPRSGFAAAPNPQIRQEFSPGGESGGYIQGLLESSAGYCSRLAAKAERTARHEQEQIVRSIGALQNDETLKGSSNATKPAPTRDPIDTQLDTNLDTNMEWNTEVGKTLERIAGVLSSASDALKNVDWTSVVRLMEAVQGDATGIKAAVDAAVPFTPRDPQEYRHLFVKFSTDPKGLALSEKQVWELTPHEWLVRFRDWNESRWKTKGSSFHKERRSAGRRLKDETQKLHHAWVEKGRPPISARLCDEFARTFFPAEWGKVKTGTKKHKNLRDRIRAAILRSDASAATKLIS
jgi:hypothetical protein